MGVVVVSDTFPSTVREAERRWYDTSRWAAWVDGLERVVAVDPGYPGRESIVTWESGPAGRGRVSEQVVAYEAGTGQTVEVDDESISGRQTVSFDAGADGVRVTLRLEYRLRRRSPITPLLDRLFIRREMAASLARTLGRFGAQLRPGRRSPATGNP